MHINGLDRLQERVPEMRGTGGFLRVALAIGGVFVLTSLFFLAADRGFPEWMPDGEIVILALGFLLLTRFYSQRKRYQERYGERAFWMAFTRFNIPGLGIVAASIGHLAYIAGPDIPNVPWRPWLVALGYVLLVGGLLLWLRAVASFGLDSLLMLYVYHPQEGPRLLTGLYQYIRHPVYSAAQHLGFGLAMIHANWYALLVALLLPLFFAGWTRLVEEPELMARFPDYGEYRRRVPAFVPRPGDFFRLWGMLIGRNAPAPEGRQT
jgi:protein-S-isoprenylcysteine O-methyltransferase Ste14